MLGTSPFLRPASQFPLLLCKRLWIREDSEDGDAGSTRNLSPHWAPAGQISLMELFWEPEGLTSREALTVNGHPTVKWASPSASQSGSPLPIPLTGRLRKDLSRNKLVPRVGDLGSDSLSPRCRQVRLKSFLQPLPPLQPPPLPSEGLKGWTLFHRLFQFFLSS